MRVHTHPMRRRTARRLTRTLVALAFLAGPVAAVVSWQLRPSPPSPASPSRAITSLHGEDFSRRTIYRSAQEVGYTSWVGAWTMPDKSLMTAFVEALGPADPGARPAIPRRVLDAFGVTQWDPGYDFWGLKLAVRYLRSRDGGRTWQRTRSDSFRAPGPYGYTPQATVALEDGTIVRRVNGDDLRHDPAVPHTAFLQRLAPGAANWSAPQVLMDPARYTYQISRLRYLRDGRLIATGNVWDVPASISPADRASVASRLLLMVSSDDGETWRNGLTIPEDAGYLPGNEWDTAELPSGDLLAVMRTLDSPATRRPVRMQGLLEKHGAGWVLTKVAKAPFPHSGHPELLATREGPILHIATTGVHYTTDGTTWRPLGFSPGLAYRSGYYPRAVQTGDGVVHVFGHVGADDPYGRADQSIIMDTFRLVAGRRRP
jgi:hypothetical protein